MQESTDAIYKFEDDAITIADKILKGVLKVQIDNIIKLSIQEEVNRQQKQKLNNGNSRQDQNKKNKQNILETILYEKMLKDYITEQDQQADSSNIVTSYRKNNFNIDPCNQSFVNKFKNSIHSSSNDKSENQQELSKILCESSVGLDKVRKSVIKQQSEQYLMNENQRSKQNNTVMFRFQDKYQKDSANVQMIFQQEESLKESLRQKVDNKHIIDKRQQNYQGKFNIHGRNYNDSINTSNITNLQQSQQTIEKNYNSSDGCFYDQVDEFNQIKKIQNPNESIVQIKKTNYVQNHQKNNNRNRSQSSDFQENLSEVQSGHDFKSKERKIIGHIFKHKNVNVLPQQNNYLQNININIDDSNRQYHKQIAPFQQKQINKVQAQNNVNIQKSQQKLSPQKTPKIMKDQKMKSFTVFNNFQNQLGIKKFEVNQQSEKQKKEEFDRKKSLSHYLQDEQIGQESQKIRTSEIHKKMSQITHKNFEDQKYDSQMNPNELLEQIKRKYKNISPILTRQNSNKRSQNSDQHQQEYRNDDGVYEEHISKLHRKVLNPTQKLQNKKKDQTFSPIIYKGYENEINHNEYLDEFQLNSILNSQSSRVSLVDNNKIQIKNLQEQKFMKQSIQVYSKQKQNDDYLGQQKNEINKFQSNRLMNSHIQSQPLSQKNGQIKKQFWFQQ